jgi:hypothetical protein
MREGAFDQEQNITINDAIRRTPASTRNSGPLVDNQGVADQHRDHPGASNIGFCLDRPAKPVIRRSSQRPGHARVLVSAVDISADDARALGLPSAEGVVQKSSGLARGCGLHSTMSSSGSRTKIITAAIWWRCVSGGEEVTVASTAMAAKVNGRYARRTAGQP